MTNFTKMACPHTFNTNQQNPVFHLCTPGQISVDQKTIAADLSSCHNQQQLLTYLIITSQTPASLLLQGTRFVSWMCSEVQKLLKRLICDRAPDKTNIWGHCESLPYVWYLHCFITLLSVCKSTLAWRSCLPHSALITVVYKCHDNYHQHTWRMFLCWIENKGLNYTRDIWCQVTFMFTFNILHQYSVRWRRLEKCLNINSKLPVISCFSW